jgi:hypothetical protein
LPARQLTVLLAEEALAVRGRHSAEMELDNESPV